MQKDQSKEFGQAYERYSDELFRHVALRLKDRERALEITQECFVKAWQYMERGEEVRDMRPFLYRILRNLIIDEYRKHKVASLEGMMTEESESVEHLLPTDDTNTLESAIERFEGKRALAILQELPDLYREVLLLRYVDGLTISEVAKQVGESENAISVRVHRGLKKLKTLMDTEEAQ